MTKYKRNSKYRYNERGNVLVLILVAVALFAALSFTVADIMRTGDPQMIGDQQAYLFADEILDHARAMRQNVQSLRINGCEDTQVSFTRESGDNYEHSPVAPDSCKLFHPSGGGLTYVRPNDKALDSSFSAKYAFGELYFSGSNEVTGIGTTCATAACMELIVFFPYVSNIVCQKLNERLDVSGAGGAIPNEDIVAFWPNEEFAGVYANAGVDRVIGDDATEVDGSMAGCVFNASSGAAFYPSNFFYQVLIAR